MYLKFVLKNVLPTFFGEIIFFYNKIENENLSVKNSVDTNRKSLLLGNIEREDALLKQKMGSVSCKNERLSDLFLKQSYNFHVINVFLI